MEHSFLIKLVSQLEVQDHFIRNVKLAQHRAPRQKHCQILRTILNEKRAIRKTHIPVKQRTANQRDQECRHVRGASGHCL